MILYGNIFPLDDDGCLVLFLFVEKEHDEDGRNREPPPETDDMIFRCKHSILEHYFKNKSFPYYLLTNYPCTMSQVQAAHILKKHKGSRRPASHRNPNITQSKDEAIAQV